MLELIALMHLRITLPRYVDLNDCITHRSIGCVTEVVFGGKRMGSMDVDPDTCGCAEQLSTRNVNFRF